MRYFTTWASRPYNFETEEIRERHHRICNTPRKAVVLTELRDILDEFYDTRYLDCVPRSKYKPEMLLEPCHRYEMGGKMPAIHWKTYRQAVSNVRNKLKRKQKVRPLALEDVPFDATKNSGLPWLTRKGDVYEQALERARACERGACPPPMVMFSRGKNLEQARPVMCGPFEWQLLEGKFFYPLQELLLSFDNFYLVGVPSCTLGSKIDEICDAPAVLMLDYTGYDGSISSTLIGSGFSILRSMLDLTEDEERQWKAICSYFVTCPIVCPDGRVYYGKDHAVPSGSMFTQAIDTIDNAIIIEYIALRLQYEIGKYYIVGDDSIVAVYNESCNMRDVVKVASELGITVNPTKSELLLRPEGAGVHFLGHTFDRGLPIRTTEDTLTRLLTPERIKKEMFSKDWEVRKRYYLERIRAYQEDNASLQAWYILRMVEERLKWPKENHGILRLQATAWDRYQFVNTETVERDRWDPSRRQLRREAGKLLVRPAVFWS